MFCPKCGAEYRKGFSKCSDCDIPLVDRLPPDSAVKSDNSELVVLRAFPTVIEAELAKSALDSIGIDSVVQSDNEGGQSPGLAFSRGVELIVRAEDVGAANDMLNMEGLDKGMPNAGDSEKS